MTIEVRAKLPDVSSLPNSPSAEHIAHFEFLGGAQVAVPINWVEADQLKRELARSSPRRRDAQVRINLEPVFIATRPRYSGVSSHACRLGANDSAEYGRTAPLPTARAQLGSGLRGVAWLSISVVLSGSACGGARGSSSNTTTNSSGGGGYVKVTTLAGVDAGFSDGIGGEHGNAEFDKPFGLAVSPALTVFVGDQSNSRVRQISPSGLVTTVAGNGHKGFSDGSGGPSGSAEFMSPGAIALDASGNIYVADANANRIRKIDRIGNVSTLTGNGKPGGGFVDGTGGPTGTAEFNEPLAIAIGSSGELYIADSFNSCIRVADPEGNVLTLAGNPSGGYMDGTTGNNGTARFNVPQGIAVDSTGIIYVSDTGNNRVRKIDKAGNVTTLAGNGTKGYADGSGGPDGGAEFNLPTGLVVDGFGSVYVADARNNRIRRIGPNGNVTTIAGTGSAGSVDGSTDIISGATFNTPTGIATDSQGALYVADEGSSRIRQITR